MKSNSFSIAVFIVFLLSPLLGSQLTPNVYVGGRSRNIADRNARNSSAIAQLLGDFRTSLSDILFIKTERYLDSGIAYVPHLDEGELSLTHETKAIDEHQSEAIMDPQARDAHEDHEHEHAAHEDHEQHEHQGVPTIIKSKDRDFRGFIGDLEREIKPFPKPGDPHEHTDGTELLPWYRVMTLADPHNTRAYAIAGFWLKYKNLDEGLRFLAEGTKLNPDSFEMHLTYGKLLLQKGRALQGPHTRYGTRPEPGSAAAEFFQRAGAEYQRAAECAMAARPRGWSVESKATNWSTYREEDALEALRMAAMVENYYGDPRQAHELARKYDQAIPDAILQRLIQAFEAPAGVAARDHEAIDSSSGENHAHD